MLRVSSIFCPWDVKVWRVTEMPIKTVVNGKPCDRCSDREKRAPFSSIISLNFHSITLCFRTSSSHSPASLNDTGVLGAASLIGGCLAGLFGAHWRREGRYPVSYVGSERWLLLRMLSFKERVLKVVRPILHLSFHQTDPGFLIVRNSTHLR